MSYEYCIKQWKPMYTFHIVTCVTYTYTRILRYTHALNLCKSSLSNKLILLIWFQRFVFSLWLKYNKTSRYAKNRYLFYDFWVDNFKLKFPITKIIDNVLRHYLDIRYIIICQTIKNIIFYYDFTLNFLKKHNEKMILR